MNTVDQDVDRAIANLSRKKIFRKGDEEFEVRVLHRLADWKEATTDWWKGKAASIIGEDSCGNYFLRHCDGTVRFWDHETQQDKVLAASVRAFLSALEVPTPAKLKPGQVKSAWIDPAFLKEQKRNGNA